MATPPDISITQKSEATSKMLRELGLPIHRVGFHQLCIGIPQFSTNPTQSLNCDVYLYVADYFGFTDYRNVERSIRDVILAAWTNRDPAVWDAYFPGIDKRPSNRLFISTLADRLK